MDEQQAREEIRLIKSMLEKTKKATAESGTLFIVWGILIAAALAGHYTLAYFHKYGWIWLNWVIIAGVGWIYSAVYGIRRERKEPVKTYIQTAARHLYFGSGVGFLLLGIIFPWLGAYSHEAIPVLMAAVNGILFFVMGGMFEWALIKWAGFLWWAGAVGMTFAKGNDRTLIFTVLFIGGYLIPAFILRSKFKKEQASK